MKLGAKKRVEGKPMQAYDHSILEKKWQKKWASAKIYKSTEGEKVAKGGKEADAKSKYYVLDMFPYPSGEGLHVGHPKGYIATDVVSRMKRMQGHSVLHPMGFDAFGLPAENYAIKMKVNPAVAVEKNVKRFKKQLEIIGLDYDWSREINTTDPAYYKWTQWIFLQMLKKDLAFESYEPINWCPVDKTGLANEDIENGRCERCGAFVEKKLMKQWVLRITDYADRLLKDLDAVDYSVYKTATVEDHEGAPCFTQIVEPGIFKKHMPVVERNAIMAIVKHWSEDKYIGLKWKKVAWQTLITGGPENGQTIEEGAVTEIAEETGYLHPKLIKNLGKVHSKFFHIPKQVNRFAHFDILYFELKDGEKNDISPEEKGNHDVVWLTAEEMSTFLTPDSHKYVWSLFNKNINTYDTSTKPLLDWPEAIKESQRNWIGRSEGAEIDFKLKIGDIKTIMPSVKVFTTRPDTLFGVTYLVLAPEHKLVSELLKNVSNGNEVTDYIAKSKLETEIERTDAKKEKTGVELKGIKAINPANNEEVPVWIADYVLADYGTGAVMAVPAHDERDWEFAKKFGLKIKQVILPYLENKRHPIKPGIPIVARNNVNCILHNPRTNEYACLKWNEECGWTTFIGGGIEDGENPIMSGLREIKEESGYTNVVFSKEICKCFSGGYAVPKKENRFANITCLLYELQDESKNEVSGTEIEKHSVVWIKKDDVASFLNMENSIYCWDIYLNGPKSYVDEGILVDSNKFSGKKSEFIKKEITESVGGKWVTKYKLRDWVFSRQRYWGEPIPVVHCEKCGAVPVPEKDLPVKLPKVKSYEPTGTGESPLAAISKWVNVRCPVCKGPAKRETNTMPQWAGSSWYYLRYMDPNNKKTLVDTQKEKYWSPVDLYIGGAEHAARHLIYARFWHKFLYDIGVASTVEPFIKLQSVGLIMGEDGRKMSKRFGNVVNPDEIVVRFGADTLRVYEMFMGPFDQQIAWSTDSMVGARRFIEKVWKLLSKVIDASESVFSVSSNSLTKTLHKTIKKVTEDIQGLKFNTAISSLMIAVNEMEKTESISRTQFELLLKILAPFAPHITEELWSELGNKKSIHISEWPIYDPKLIQDDDVRIIVQINGKMRGSFNASKDTSQQSLENTAKALPEIQKWLDGKTIKKVVVVPNRLVSIVVS